MAIIWDNRPMSKIQMIKEIREVSGAGLKDAKDAIEEAGGSLDNSVADYEVISLALHILDPQQHPLASTELDYKKMWLELCDHVSGAVARQMEEIKVFHEEHAKKVKQRNLTTMALKRALSSTFEFSTVPGDDSVHVYDRNGVWIEELKMSREKFKDMVQEALGEWLRLNSL